MCFCDILMTFHPAHIPCTCTAHEHTMYHTQFSQAEWLRSQRSITAPELEQFVVGVQLTGVSLGIGAYGSVEEVEIPGALAASQKISFPALQLELSSKGT